MYLAFALVVTSGCPNAFSLAGLRKERLVLPLLHSGSKRRRIFQLFLYSTGKLHFPSRIPLESQALCQHKVVDNPCLKILLLNKN